MKSKGVHGMCMLPLPGDSASVVWGLWGGKKETGISINVASH